MYVLKCDDSCVVGYQVGSNGMKHPISKRMKQICESFISVPYVQVQNVIVHLLLTWKVHFKTPLSLPLSLPQGGGAGG